MQYNDIQLKINNTTIPAPIDMSYSLEDIDKDSGRDIKDAKMYRNRQLADVVKIGITYEINDVDSISTLMNLISDTFFDVEYFDIKSKTRVTKEFYAGSKSFNFVCVGDVFVKGLKFNIVQRG